MFWRKKRSPSQIQEQVSSGVARAIGNIQLRFGRTLNKKTANWTRRQQKVYLGLFLFGMISIVGYQLLNHQSGTEGVMLPVPGTLPKLPLYLPKQPTEETGYLKPDSSMLTRFRQRLHQLQSTSAGRDSLAKFEAQRPGFIDSVLQWESAGKSP